MCLNLQCDSLLHAAFESPGPDHRLAVPPTPRVFDRIRTLIIGEAGGKLAEDRDAFFDSRRSSPPPSLLIAPLSNCARFSSRFLGMKSKDKLDTLCGHKDCSLSWQNFFLMKG